MVSMQNENLKRQLKAALNRYYRLNHGFNNADIEDERPYEIEEQVNKDENYTDVYIYTDITLDEFFKALQPQIDKVVQKFDPSAYFDAVKAGDYMSRVYWGNASSKADAAVMTNKNLINLANKLCDIVSDDYSDDFVTSNIEFKDDKIYIDIVGEHNEAQAYIDVPDASLISTYQELEDEYLDQLIDAVETNMETL